MNINYTRLGNNRQGFVTQTPIPFPIMVSKIHYQQTNSIG